MVAEAVAETTTTPPVEETQAPPPEQETRTEPIADAAKSQEQEAPADADAAWQAHREASKGSETPAPESRARREDDPAYQAEVRNRGNLHRTNLGVRAARIDALKQELVDVGVPESLASRFIKDSKDILNEHHAEGLTHAGYAAAQAEVAAEQQAFSASVFSLLPKAKHADLNHAFKEIADKNGGSVPYDAFINAAVELKMRDYTANSDVEKLREADFRSGYEAGQKSAGINKSSSTGEGGGMTAAVGKFRNLAEARAMHAADQITDDEMRAAKAAHAAGSLSD